MTHQPGPLESEECLRLISLLLLGGSPESSVTIYARNEAKGVEWIEVVAPFTKDEPRTFEGPVLLAALQAAVRAKEPMFEPR